MLLPDWIDVEAWEGYEEMRRKIRKPMTDRARTLAVRELEKLKAAGNDPNEVLDQSTLHSWQGLFELREKSKPKQVDTTPEWLEFRKAIQNNRLPENMAITRAIQTFGGLYRLGSMSSYDLDRKRGEFDSMIRMKEAA